ncbi:MAG: hypothetical protein AB1498_06745 [bacterium]
MGKTAVNIDLLILKEEARKELFDFYEFLIKKYGVKKVAEGDKFEKIISNPLKVDKIIIPAREELYER